MIPKDKKIKVWIRFFFICWTISKMAKKWPTPISVHYFIFLSEFFQISYMDCFHKLSLKFEYKFCPTKVNQDVQQNGRHLLVCTYRHSTLVIYYPIAAKFHIYVTFINILPKFEYGLCPKPKWPPNGRHLSVYTCGHYLDVWVVFDILKCFLNEWQWSVLWLYQIQNREGSCSICILDFPLCYRNSLVLVYWNENVSEVRLYLTNNDDMWLMLLFILRQWFCCWLLLLLWVLCLIYRLLCIALCLFYVCINLDVGECYEYVGKETWLKSICIFTDHSMAVLLLWIFFFYLCFVFVMLSCHLFIAVLWSPAWKGLTSWLSCMWWFIVFYHFRIGCPGSNVVLECIGCWSLHPFLL